MLQPQLMPLIFQHRSDGPDASSFPDKPAAFVDRSPDMASPPPPPAIDTSVSSTVTNGSAIKPNPASKSPHSPQDFAPPARNFTAPVVSSQPSTQTSTSPKSQAASSDASSQQQAPSLPPIPQFSSPLLPSAVSSSSSADRSKKPVPPPLVHRHTLEVPRVVTSPRVSRDYQPPNSASTEDGTFASGRSLPSSPRNRGGSLTLVRRVTKSLHSDHVHPDDRSVEDDNARWSETMRPKRGARRRRKDDEEDDDRVVVGTKVDQNHVNWVTAYNMLTGIRFTVSRTNAKIRNGELTYEHFDAKHKFSFDVTGNALMPSAKYDFKFKDYAPEVFRELRSIFRIDPANYLVSLTSKYILSELGSPGKSGGFFYFSRDYKYIIKTIHPGEHRLLRRVLRDYYNHVRSSPNTLLSQFYGLHRVKIPYGRKIHFVVMNNLFPPHRDIHRIFDLKGSTIGRDFREEDLETHPRATLKDLNWLRRNLHIEFGSQKKKIFIEQMEKDVALLKKLKIMDYSLLVGIHDLGKGNEENLRDRTLQVFQPHGEEPEEERLLMRTQSKLENVRKAKELRQNLRAQKPVPIGSSTNKMPNEMPEDMKGSTLFYSDDGGFQASHADNRPGEEIYYLGIIDCLTKYNFIKRSEHFLKGLTNPKSQISAVPPDKYGSRFLKFIGSITVPREEQGEREKSSEGQQPDRMRTTTDGSSVDGATLPVVEEVGETASTGEKSGEGTGNEDAGKSEKETVAQP